MQSLVSKSFLVGIKSTLGTSFTSYIKPSIAFSLQTRDYSKKKGGGSSDLSPKRFTSPIFLKRALRQWLSSRKRSYPRRRRRIKTLLEEIAIKKNADQIFDQELELWLKAEEERKRMRLEAINAIDCPNLKNEARRRTLKLFKNAAFSKVPTDLPTIPKWKSSFLQYHLKELEEIHDKKQKQRELLSAK